MRVGVRRPGFVQALTLEGKPVWRVRRDRAFEVCKLNLSTLLGDRFDHADAVLRMANLLTDVELFNFHAAGLDHG